ncbi:MAG: hypothetical protein JWM33_3027 [Caulobacteraceae bacterium]|nr:hypothetical protein [Caulobacteraceae bacterium]
MPLKFEHRVGVSAPGEVVWEILADLDHWKDWNPLYPEAHGRIGHGETLILTQKLPGHPPEVIRPRITDWTPEDLLHWRLDLARGWVRSIRYMEIEKLADDACIFSNGEMFMGLLAGFMVRKLRRELRAAYAMMGEALKVQAEARWQTMPESQLAKPPPAPKKKPQPSISLVPAPSRVVTPKLKSGAR